MPIANYNTPGVYVTQAPAPSLATSNPASLTICLLGYAATAPSGSQTDYFNINSLTQSGSGNASYTLSQSPLSTNSTVFTVKLNSGTFATLASGTDYTVSGTTLSILSGTMISGTLSGVNTQFLASYSYATAVTGTYYRFNNFNSVQATFGPAFNTSSATATINSPVTLAASLAFQNGAENVVCCNIAGSGTESDFLSAFTTSSGVVAQSDIDVIIPLVGVTSSGVLVSGMKNYLNGRATNGTYQRAFVGFSATSTAASGVENLKTQVNSIVASGANSSRISLVAPPALTVNPGLNSQGLATGQVTADGFYLAAALAGTFVGQTDVYIPITHKNVNGFLGIPNQISSVDSQTVQSLGATVVRQRNDGTIYVRHGLTTDLTNWLTQEISISAIGDRLSNNIKSAIDNSGVIGSPLTQTTLSSLQSIVLATLMRAVNTNLIQSYQNLTYSINPATPTTVNVTFQYSPTFPLNYVQVAISINAQSGNITTASNVGNSIVQ